MPQEPKDNFPRPQPCDTFRSTAKKDLLNCFNDHPQPHKHYKGITFTPFSRNVISFQIPIKNREQNALPGYSSTSEMSNDIIRLLCLLIRW